MGISGRVSTSRETPSLIDSFRSTTFKRCLNGTNMYGNIRVIACF